ncbi:TIGR01777 family oxidoreductase [Thiotrichales bacterium 19S3-7]|nr:TIGR01777 family oxidoreductase [Thiotrichales bacterium 19S3-7]MCF6802970.1 TIGR01777 family oxidoreductase [Thiotrichales bacterium 19S3-11]
MKILIAGGSGFIGRRLANCLSENHELTLLSREKQKNIEGYNAVLTWDELDEALISQFDIVINLCGYGIAEKKWSSDIKSKIINSRIKPTQKLVELIGDKSIWLINASAIGYYAFSDKVQSENDYIQLDEDDYSFSQIITHQWEKIITKSDLKQYTIVRFGVVLGKGGGMISKIKTPAKFGLGMKIGSGKQLISWVHIDDLASAILFIINHQLNKDIINITAPNACTQKHLIQTLCNFLYRPQLVSMPEIIVKKIFGQMGVELLLSSQNIQPEKLTKNGFKFNYPIIESAIYDLIKK